MHFFSDNPFGLTDLHTLTGQIALWLMLAHAIWATRVIQQNKKSYIKRFTDTALLYG